jgi:hypothetical protein
MVPRAFVFASLALLPSAGLAQAGLPSGLYTCSMSGAAGQFPVTIKGSTYTDRAGKTGSFTQQGDRLVFASGSLQGQFSKVLGRSKFGLSSSPTGSFYGVCNLKT